MAPATSSCWFACGGEAARREAVYFSVFMVNVGPRSMGLESVRSAFPFGVQGLPRPRRKAHNRILASDFQRSSPGESNTTTLHRIAASISTQPWQP